MKKSNLDIRINFHLYRSIAYSSRLEPSFRFLSRRLSVKLCNFIDDAFELPTVTNIRDQIMTSHGISVSSDNE